MNKPEFSKLLDSIRGGAMTASQMEDVVYAMHCAYVDHHAELCEQLPTNLEDVADTMVLARKNTERFSWEEDMPANAPRKVLGYVHTVAAEAL